LSATGEREAEARASAEAFLAGAKRPPRIVLESFRDSFFPYDGAQVKEAFERLKEVSPQLVLTHAGTDFHQDHRLAAELTWNTFRNHVILEFEIPKYDGDLGRPNVFVPLEESVVRRKVELLLEHFQTQRSRYWFTEDLFLGLMRLRGMEANSPTGYAEAFRSRKLQLSPSSRRSQGESPRHRTPRLHRLGDHADARRGGARRRRSRHVLLRGLRPRQRRAAVRGASRRHPRRDPRRAPGVRRGRPSRRALERPARRPGRGADVRHQPPRDASRGRG